MLETDSAMIVPYYYLMSIQVDYLREIMLALTLMSGKSATS